jgi:pyruvate kinase
VTIPIDPPMLRAMRPGDVVRLTDARGRRRELAVRVLTETSGLCESSRTGYVTSGMPLEVTRGGRRVHVGEVGHLEARARSLLLAAGDSLVITRDGLPGRPATCDELGRVIEPARIGCTLPEVFSAVGPGQRILLDDGKFEGLIRTTQPDRFQVELYRVGGGTARLRAEKGINLPDTRLDLSAITDKDRADLEFVARHADLVSVSFVRHPDDVEELHRELERLGAGNVGIVLKIEKGQAFEHLPRLLLAALRRPPVAVMLARGDLAVEVGFERLAEVQEEILWLCEAAHVPVIWATQVLESLAKSGIPSRGEVTDAAMSGRAECVMLNKGPYIGEAVRFLDDVLRRMRDHHVKRVATLRKLKVAGDYPLPRRPRPAAMPLQA